ncbi:MAG: SEC59/DGK1/VTE5 family protein [Pseudanabaenaceae cyanobacterium bins.68]|nr:SEC59/DGK1/VTE5 family protein [Pseudanabaenaceae cyanobacterium bins.68]
MPIVFSWLEIQVSAIAAWLGFMFLLVSWLDQQKAEPELVRKVMHIGAGQVLLIAWLLQVPLVICLGFSLLFSAIALVSYYLPILPMLNSVGRKTLGVFYYALSITILVAVFWSINQPQYAAIGVLVMAWGDGLAALVGTRWGKNFYQIGNNRKTLEGSLAMAIASYLVMLGVLAIVLGNSWAIFLIPLPVALVAAGLEAVSPGGTDNLTVPLVSAGLCYGFVLIAINFRLQA